MREKRFGNIMELWWFILSCLVTGSLCDINSTGCGTNDVHFDYSTLPKQQIIKRIIGGQTATKYAFPWMATLQYNGIHFCGGSLLKGNHDKWYIVTSAHCIDGTDVTGWKILLGVHNLASPDSASETLNASALYTNPQYVRTTLQGDIGLLQLASAPSVQRPGINFACMATEPARDGEHCYVIGWGSTIVGGPPTDYLQVVDKPVMSNSKCQDIYKTSFHEPSMICAGYDEGGKDSCAFDSGGPLMCYRNNRMEIIGTVSWGMGCAEPNTPAVYSRAYAALQWIRNTIYA